MAYALWKFDKRPGRHGVLVCRWRDPAAPGGWREERRPNDRTKGQALDYAREMEKRADRQAKGLETEPTRATFGEIWDRWWDGKGRRRRGTSKRDFRLFLEKHLAELRPLVIMPATAGAFADRLDALLAEKDERHELAPQSLNHLRAGVHGMFEHARDPKVQLWQSENPIAWVKRRKLLPRRYETLRRDQVLPLLNAFPAPSLLAPWRWAAAVCIYAAPRPGEIFGLWKEDVDLDSGTLTIWRSWTQPTPKDGEPRSVLIVSELRPYLVEAMQASPNHLLFPRPDGKPYGPETRFRLVDHLRRALCKIGDVLGYDHTCRRCKARAAKCQDGVPAEFKWRFTDAAQRRCPVCGMKLWIAPVPRPVRFYDLRHTHATLLRKARVDLGTVQKLLGHSSPEITAGTYDHSEIEDDRMQLERVLSFKSPIEIPAPRPAGAPNSMLADALDAPGAPDSGEARSNDFPRMIPGALDAMVCETTGHAWGASGRWFKSSRPDH